jgi:hypothetical protein
MHSLGARIKSIFSVSLPFADKLAPTLQELRPAPVKAFAELACRSIPIPFFQKILDLLRRNVSFYPYLEESSCQLDGIPISTVDDLEAIMPSEVKVRFSTHVASRRRSGIELPEKVTLSDDPAGAPGNPRSDCFMVDPERRFDNHRLVGMNGDFQCLPIYMEKTEFNVFLAMGNAAAG